MFFSIVLIIPKGKKQSNLKAVNAYKYAVAMVPCPTSYSATGLEVRYDIRLKMT